MDKEVIVVILQITSNRKILLSEKFCYYYTKNLDSFFFQSFNSERIKRLNRKYILSTEKKLFGTDVKNINFEIYIIKMIKFSNLDFKNFIKSFQEKKSRVKKFYKREQNQNILITNFNIRFKHE